MTKLTKENDVLPDYRTYHTAATPPLKEEFIQGFSTLSSSDIQVNSLQMDRFWEAVYHAIDSFPTAARYLYNNQISIGTIFSPDIIRALTTEMTNDSIIRKEIAKATDFIAINAHNHLGSSRAIIDMVIDVSKVFRISPPLNPKMILIEDELEDYTFETEQGLSDLIDYNVWLSTFYVLAYVAEFIAGPKLPEILNATQANQKFAI